MPESLAQMEALLLRAMLSVRKGEDVEPLLVELRELLPPDATETLAALERLIAQARQRRADGEPEVP